MGYFLWLKIWKIKLIIATINLQNSNKVEYVIMLSPPFFLKLLRSMPKNILNTILSFWLHFTYVAIYKNVKRFWWILYFSNSSFLAFQKCNVKSPCSIQWGKAGEKKVILLLASQHSRWLCCVNFNPCTTCMVHVCLYNIHIAPFQKSSKNFGKKLKKFLNLVILLFSWERYFVCIWEIAYKEKCKAVFLQWAYVFLLSGVYRETDTTESRQIWAYAANQSGDIQ